MSTSRDGEIDYSHYTLLELEEALAGIDPKSYPINHAHLRSAYERLTSSLPADALYANREREETPQGAPWLSRIWNRTVKWIVDMLAIPWF